MKNISCIFMELSEFQECINEAYGGEIYIDVSLDGISIEATDCYERMAKYFGVDKITSIHIDDYSPVGVWIAYKNKEEDIVDIIGLK